MRALINKAKIKEYRQISNSVKDDVINRYILDAQQFDLLPAIGKTNYEVLFTDATKLNNGTDTNGGVDMALALFAFARYTFFSGDVDTPFSNVNKKYNDSTKTDRGRLKEIYANERRLAMTILNNLKLLVRNNLSTIKINKI